MFYWLMSPAVATAGNAPRQPGNVTPDRYPTGLTRLAPPEPPCSNGRYDDAVRWCAERVCSGQIVGYDADLVATVILVTVGGMVSSGTVHPLLLQPMLC